MKTQKQLYESSRRKTAVYNEDLMFLRKSTAQHYVDCNIYFAEAWNREREYNKRIKNNLSIIFPSIECFKNHYDYALKHALKHRG